MKKVLYRHLFSKVLGLSLLLSSTSFYAQEATEAAAEPTTEVAADAAGGDAVKGKQLFNQNCAACHALDRKMTGPALANVETRLADDEGLDKEWIYAWVKNSPGVISSGDAYASKIYSEYNQAAMTPFPTLSNQDIDDILAYTAAPPATPAATPAAAGGAAATTGASSGISNELILGALALIFGLLVLMLFLVNKTLKRIAEANGVVLEQEREKRMPIWKAFIKNQFLVLVTVIFLLLSGAYFAYGYLMQVGVDQGYAPVQPIHFSHKIHAGDNKVECKYCHSSARVSKTSGIPSLNVCMNCHKSIYQYAGNPEGPSAEDLAAGHTNDFYTGEIKKLYKAVGWDEENQSYTGETQPVEWVRIHNLPDFAYFNHSQHVSVAGVECQTCHGPVEEMEIVEQFAPLTMGWCINCHRETNVKMEGNEYYEAIHEELSKKYGVEELTAAMMGGLECGKCHY
ncbi:cytochrome c3 family protein [Flagellimonas zhangzhouensis]|uniref:Quinol:cytochrome c oxidoreductase pentaheme cytochrome subunit n=1 Tax=Flagellimonas zhangzhouensis TaxID=1073328 RepID=A0A1H2WYS0_9FLAO|nr:cytochrome c3 family protein [Allomuricauda zhangzhouensis]SDQ26126.1 quinol:cytochrome c oxidoreductase pentaheme cytochrome subunit [Allomuricauda zhangzhouensis]SDW85697.1 quinol:cytochrome c oxidoreductase pentaheme cytochrome subunit [Allomuricauda zhangzhouensis]